MSYLRVRENRFVVLLALLAVASLAAPRGLGAQSNSGIVQGTVTDPSGAVLPGVNVTVTNVDTGVVRDFVTNSDGLYDTNSILPGSYTITFSKDGFQKLVVGPITLQIGLVILMAGASPRAVAAARSTI